MRNGAAAAPLLRMRDVAPAAVAVVVLLGVGGCMGAFGGGPLDGDGDWSPTVSADAREIVPSPETSPSILAVEPDGGTEQYLFDFVDELAESKRSGKAPAAFTNREALFSCGEFVLGQGETLPPEAWDCLAERLETGAEIVLAQPTTEGDPIITYYRVGPGIDGMEYFTDPTFDTWGADAWEHMLCAIETDPLSVVNCVRADSR